MEDGINNDSNLHLSTRCVVPQLQNSVVGCQLTKSDGMALTNYALLSRGRRLSDEDEAAVGIVDVELGHAVVPVE